MEYRDIFGVLRDDICDACELLTSVRDSLKHTEIPEIDRRSEEEKRLELERDNRELNLRLAGSIWW